MNILPKKRWHVRTKQNIERVRRDEAQAAEEERELSRRIRLAEQEARTDLLRKRAKGIADHIENPPNSTSKHVEKLEDSKSEHVNFFKELEENGYTDGKNKEHEDEEKAIKEKFEKDLGILVYLGQNSLEAKGETPWYLKAELKNLSKSDDKDDVVSIKQKAKLDKMDPLNDIKKYLSMKGHKYVEHYKSSKKEDSKVDKYSKTESSNVSRKSKMSIIEGLRAKRLKRESEEKQRSQKYLETLRKGPTQEVILDDRSRKYNSQFNPHLARNNLTNEKEYRFQ